MSNLSYRQTSLKDPLLSVSLFCHLASIIPRALILSETLALYKSFTYLLLSNMLRQVSPIMGEACKDVSSVCGCIGSYPASCKMNLT